MLLAGLSHHVEGAHDQTRAVADDAHRAVELDVVEALLLGGLLQRVLGGGVHQVGVRGLPEVGVLVQRHLAVEGDDVAGAGRHQRVDLDEGGVLLDEDGPELLEHAGDLVGQLALEAGRRGDLGGLGRVDAGERVDGDAGQGLGPLDGQGLDLHTALLAGHGQPGAVGAVEQEGDVVLLRDVRALRDHHPLDRVALDVHAQDVAGVALGLLGGRRDLDPAGLAAAADLDLRLDDDDAADALGRGPRLLRSRGHLAGEHGYAVLLEHVARLVLVQVHVWFTSSGSSTSGGDHGAT